jgi:hypothetical protein
MRIDIAAYAFGGLDSRDWQAMTLHLTDCVSCRAEHEGYADLVNLMATVRPWEAAPGAPCDALGHERAVTAVRAADAAWAGRRRKRTAGQPADADDRRED